MKHRATRVSIQARILAVMGLIALGMAALIVVGVTSIKERMLLEREVSMNHVVDVALGVVEAYVAEEESGNLT